MTDSDLATFNTKKLGLYLINAESIDATKHISRDLSQVPRLQAFQALSTAVGPIGFLPERIHILVRSLEGE